VLNLSHSGDVMNLWGNEDDYFVSHLQPMLTSRLVSECSEQTCSRRLVNKPTKGIILRYVHIFGTNQSMFYFRSTYLMLCWVTSSIAVIKECLNSIMNMFYTLILMDNYPIVDFEMAQMLILNHIPCNMKIQQNYILI
jgi:hypothetical protein